MAGKHRAGADQRRLGLLAALGLAVANVAVAASPARANFLNVGLFRGVQAKLGCEPQDGRSWAQANDSTRSPSVALPWRARARATALTADDPDGSRGRYGRR